MSRLAVAMVLKLNLGLQEVIDRNRTLPLDLVEEHLVPLLLLVLLDPYKLASIRN